MTTKQNPWRRGVLAAFAASGLVGLALPDGWVLPFVVVALPLVMGLGWMVARGRA